MGIHRHNFALALVCGLPVVAALFVGLRFLARYRLGIRYAWDDWLLVVATLLSFGLIGPSVLDIRMFMRGYHVWEYAATAEDLHEWDFNLLYGIIMGFNLLSIPILPLSKASMLLLLLRVGKVLDWIRRFLYATFVFNLLSATIPWILFIFMCPPASGGTSAPSTFHGLKCFDRAAQGELLLFINCANLLTDLLIFPIPFFIMRELVNTNWRSKITILLTFASSLCVTALSALKVHGSYRDRVSLTDQPDWRYSIEYCITHGEAVVGIIVACLPTLRGLITRKNFIATSPETTWPSYDSHNPSCATHTFSRTRRIIARYTNMDLRFLTPSSDKESDESRSSSMSELIIQGVPSRMLQPPNRGAAENQHTFNPTAPLPPVGQE